MASIIYTPNYIEGITDKAEKFFALLAYTSGYIVIESDMLKAPKTGVFQQGATIPDFILKKSRNDLGIYIEVTKGKKRSSRKNRQREVMKRLNLDKRYYQITLIELQNLAENGHDLYAYIQQQIEMEI